MKRQPQLENRLSEFLLGRVSLQEHAAIEERYLSDPAFLDELRTAERELIVRYVRGELIASDREQFEKIFLGSPARRERVDEARARIAPPASAPAAAAAATPATAAPAPSPVSMAAPQPAPKPPAPPRLEIPVAEASILDRLRQPAWAAVGLLIVVSLAAWIFFQTQDRPAAATIAETAPPAPVPALRSATFVLAPALSRSAVDEMTVVTVEPGVRIRLQLTLEGIRHETYRVLLLTVDGAEVWRQDRLTAESDAASSAIVIEPPTDSLENGEYTIGLSGARIGGADELLGSYYFKVVKNGDGDTGS